MIELVLPSGRFARQARKPTMTDLVLSYHENPIVMTVMMASRIIEIDGVLMPPSFFMEMDAEDFMPLFEVVGKELKRMMAHTKGIA